MQTARKGTMVSLLEGYWWNQPSQDNNLRSVFTGIAVLEMLKFSCFFFLLLVVCFFFGLFGFGFNAKGLSAFFTDVIKKY